MKTKTGILAAFLLLLVFTSMKLDPKNPPTGQTGAPNEATCSTTSGCHSGGNYSGNVELTGLPEVITPSTEYGLSLTLSSTCVRTGFELTVLTNGNTKCGDLVAGTNSNLKTAGTRQYIRQTNPTNLSGGKATFSFKWKSPATIVRDTANFYFVMLQANGNGNDNGDNVARGQKIAVMQTISGTEDVQETFNLKAYPNPVTDFLHLSFSNNESSWQLFASSGKLLKTFTINGTGILDVRSLASGNYFLRLIDNKIKVTKQFTKD